VESRRADASAAVVTGRFVAGCFKAGEVTFTVATNDPEFAALVGDALRDLRVADTTPSPVVFEVFHRDSSPETNPWGLWRDGEPREMTVTDDYILPYLLWEITRLMFERSGDRVHLHGAALAHDGRAVVLAGHSEAGKSTLAGWLTHRGWGFLTDEAALVDPATRMVFPFWRPIGVRRPGPLDAILPGPAPEGNAADEVLVPASTIGTLGPPAPLVAIAFPSRAPGEPTSLRPVSPAATLMELTRHFPGLIDGGRAGFRRLARLVEDVPGYDFRFHDLDEAEQALRHLVRQAP
jgi:hypothetical protein